MKQILTMIAVSLILLSCQTIPAVKDDQLVGVNRESFSYDGGKVIIGEIEGYPEAVGLLKSSLISALMSRYTAAPEKAGYTISGSIFAKKYWRKGRPYIYHTVDLRLTDKDGNVVMAMHNTKPLWQAQLKDFSMQVVTAIK
jgi:hypothetical protein